MRARGAPATARDPPQDLRQSCQDVLQHRAAGQEDSPGCSLVRSSHCAQLACLLLYLEESMSCESCMACMACRVAAHGKKLNRSKVMGVNVAETW